MPDFISLLKKLKSNDKIHLNLLLLISETTPSSYQELCTLTLNHYKSCINKEAVREYVYLLCKKNEEFCDIYCRYRIVFDDIKDRLSSFLEDNNVSKRIKMGGINSGGSGSLLRDGSLVNSGSLLKDSKGSLLRDGCLVNGSLLKDGSGNIKNVQGLESRNIFNKDINNINRDNQTYIKDTPTNIKDSTYNKNSTNNIQTTVSTSHNTPQPYDILFSPLQCKLCGLRYTPDTNIKNTTLPNTNLQNPNLQNPNLQNTSLPHTSSSYEIHLQDHIRKNRALDEKQSLNREYFSTLENWIKNLEKITLNLKIDKIEKIIYTGDNLYCQVCNNKIKTEWDEDEDAFVLNECVKIDEDEYCHKQCVM